MSPQPHYVGGDTKMNKSQLIQSLHNELEDLRQEISRRRRGDNMRVTTLLLQYLMDLIFRVIKIL